MKFTFLILIIFLFASCKKKDYLFYEGNAQGTTFHITYESNTNFDKQIDEILNNFNSVFSIYDSLSDISKINNNDTSVLLNEEFKYLLDISSEINNKTGGSFDITVGPLVKAWGFGFKNNFKLNQQEVDSILKNVNFNLISYTDKKIFKKDKNVMLDCNAIAQGYSVDLVAIFLEKNNVNNYLVEIGGEVRATGVNKNGNTWRVGVDKPIENTTELNRELQSVIALTNKSLATSGNYRKFFIEDGIKYSHTIDPKTGFPSKNSLLSVTVLADECIKADAYATSFMVMGLENSLKFLETENRLDAYFIYNDSIGNLTEYYTKGFNTIYSKAE